MKKAMPVIVAAILSGVALAAPESLEQMRERARGLVRQMTLDEKVGLMMNRSKGVPRLGIPDYVWWSEALHGVARNGKATMFPQPIGLAASFDPKLVREVAEAIGEEARVKYEAAQSAGRQEDCTGLTFWSPNVNIFRDPRWGRGMETWGEDPYLTGVLGTAFVKGLQGDDPVYLKTAACAKHFAVHSGPEKLRHSFDVSPSRKDLYETYLPAFRRLVQEGKVEAVMSAYNRVYGESASSSKLLLMDILRGEYGFDGHVVSDCGAVTDIYKNHGLEKTPEGAAARAIRNGLTLECGRTFGSLAKAVEQGLVPEAEIDAAVERLLVTRLRLGILGNARDCPFRGDPAKLCSAEHVALARRSAAASMVLLKNDGVLPFDQAKTRNYLVTGSIATDAFALMGNYYGFPPRLSTYLEGFADALEPSTGMTFIPGYYHGIPVEKVPGMSIHAPAVVVFLGNTGIFEGEEGDAVAASDTSGDRTTLALPAGQMEYLRKVRHAHDHHALDSKIVTVVTGGSPVELREILEISDAVVMAWYGGQEGGAALADLLFGKTDFTARLPMTFPTSADVLPPFEDYLMAGRTYRYQSEGIEFPFGYGLSYASAEYRSVSVSADRRVATVVLENKGARDALETVQIYVETPNAGKGAPLMSLRGFAKVAVPSGASVTAKIALDADAFTEIDADGKTRAVTGTCKVWAASAAPCVRSRALGFRACSTEL